MGIVDLLGLKSLFKNWHQKTQSQKAYDKQTRKERRRKNNDPSDEIKEQLKQLWEQLYIFDFSDGDKHRQKSGRFTNGACDYVEFFKRKRFQTDVYKRLEKLLELKKSDIAKRTGEIQRKPFGKVLEISYGTF
jgi:hypothetical protein